MIVGDICVLEVEGRRDRLALVMTGGSENYEAEAG